MGGLSVCGRVRSWGVSEGYGRMEVYNTYLGLISTIQCVWGGPSTAAAAAGESIAVVGSRTAAAAPGEEEEEGSADSVAAAAAAGRKDPSLTTGKEICMST